MIAFIFGIVLVSWLAVLPSVGLWALAGGLVLLLWLLAYGWHAAVSLLPLPPLRHLTRYIRFFAGCLVIAFAGFSWGLVYGYWGVSHRLPESWQGQDISISGRVTGLVTQAGDYCRFKVKLSALHLPQQLVAEASTQPLLRNIQLANYRCFKPPHSGQQGVWQVRLKKPVGYRNPGGFDRQRHLFSQRIDATGYVVASDTDATDIGATDALLPQQQVPLWATGPWRSRLSDWLAQAVKEHTGSTQQAGLLQALLVGDKRRLSERQWQMLRQTGTMHLMIISGLHIGLVCAAVFGMTITFGRLLPMAPLRYRRAVAVLLALLAATGYAALAGFTLPTQRALIMAAVVLLSLVSQGYTRPFRRALLAAALVLVIDPLAAWSAGFWMSFAATTALLYLCLQNRPGRRAPARADDDDLGAEDAVRRQTADGGIAARLCYSCGQLLRVQFAMLVVSVPMLAWWFYQVPWVSPLINFIAVPVVSLCLLPLAMLSLCISALLPEWGALGLSVVAVILHQGLLLMAAVADWANSHIAGLWRPGMLNIGVLGLALLGIILLLAPRAMPGRWLGVLLMLPLLSAKVSQRLPGEFQVTVLDVGQGLAVYVETAGHRLLFDTADSYANGKAVAQYTVEPFLRRQGVHQLDTVVVSHSDRDHAGGLAFLMDAFKPTALFSHRRVQLPDLPVKQQHCSERRSWVWEGVHFRFLHPSAASGQVEEYGDENNRSCVLRIDSVYGSVLLTGDIEAAVETRLTALPHLASTLLVVPHHGSRTSSSTAFIKAVSPRWAVVSAGYRNRYRHPHPKVVQRYQDAGVALLLTAEQGAVTATFSRGNSQLRSYVEHQRRYWW